MKRICLLLVFWPVLQAAAQEKTVSKKELDPLHVLHTGILFPAGDFSSTHKWGIVMEYSPALTRKKQKKISCTWQGGMALFDGKKENTGGYPYRYPVYFLVQAGGLLQYRPAEKWVIQGAAGPGISRYDGSSRFLLYHQFFSGYAFSRTITAGIRLNGLKESGAQVLWSAGLGCLIYLN